MVGNPCGFHGPYTFYKGIRISQQLPAGQQNIDPNHKLHENIGSDNGATIASIKNEITKLDSINTTTSGASNLSDVKFKSFYSNGW